MKIYIIIPLILFSCLILADAVYLALNYNAWWASLISLNFILIGIFILTHYKEWIRE